MVNQELVDYLKRNLEKGFTIQDLRETLLQAGYSESEVNTAINSINEGKKDRTVPSLISQTQLKKISIERILFVIILLGLGINIIYGGIKLIYGGGVIAYLFHFFSSVIPVIGTAGSIFGGIFIVLGGAFVLLGIFQIIAAYGWLRLRNWARILTIITLAIPLILTIVGIPLGILVIWICMRKKTKEEFGVA